MAKEKSQPVAVKTTIKCNCVSDFQDQRYGKGVRVCTPGGTRERPEYKCTVCGKVQL